MGKIMKNGVELSGSSNSAENIKYDDTKNVKAAIDEIRNYSTEEIVCGTWIDGKDIYRMSGTSQVEFTSDDPTTAEVKIITDRLPENMKSVVKIVAIAHFRTGTSQILPHYFSEQNRSNIGLNNAGGLYIQFWCLYTGTVSIDWIVEYTKN